MNEELAATKIQAVWRGYSARRDPNHIFQYSKFLQTLSIFKQKLDTGHAQELEEKLDPEELDPRIIRAWYTGNYVGETDTITLYRYVNWYPYLDEMLASQLPLIPRGIKKLMDSKNLSVDTINKVHFIEDNYKLNIPRNHPSKEIWDLFCKRDKTDLCEYFAKYSDSTSANNPDELIIYWTTNPGDLVTQSSWSDCDTLIEVTLPKHAAFRTMSEGVDMFEQEWDTFGALPFRYISKIIHNNQIIFQRNRVTELVRRCSSPTNDDLLKDYVIVPCQPSSGM